MSAAETLGGKARERDALLAARFGMASGSAASFDGTRSKSKNQSFNNDFASSRNFWLISSEGSPSMTVIPRSS